MFKGGRGVRRDRCKGGRGVRRDRCKGGREKGSRNAERQENEWEGIQRNYPRQQPYYCVDRTEACQFLQGLNQQWVVLRFPVLLLIIIL